MYKYISRHLNSNTGCPPPPKKKRKWKRLIDRKTKCFCSIINFSCDLDTRHSTLDFETKFAQIGYELTETSI